ncbi:hypothetical protein, partial [Alistipes finegoldii]|uniref:hypothetical protein n=1 Tax=Alistipes finegoldii TaxID=214856 RepID=UPI00241DFD60
RTEMSRKTEYVHNPCFLSANILKILGVFAENQKKIAFLEKYRLPIGIYWGIVYIFVSVNRNSEYRNYANFAKRYGTAVTTYYKVKTTFTPLTNFRLFI